MSTHTDDETVPRIATHDEWQAAALKLRAREKEATRARDALAAARRRLPMLRVDGHYEFEGPAGPATLLDLFDGRRQLIVYHFMWDQGDEGPCTGCCMFVDNLGHPAHLHARDTSLVLVSKNAPVAELQAVKRRMGWSAPWFSTPGDAFFRDHDVRGGFGLNVFLRDGDDVYRTYFTTGRGVEALGSVWTLLDLTPLGRQETWEDSPAGHPQTPPYEWWRLHDEYEDEWIARERWA